MKKIISIYLLIFFLFSSVGRFGVFLTFKINQEYISKNLCENRFNKKSSCKGKCYLAKELKKHDTHEEKSKKENSKLEDYIVSPIIIEVSTIFTIKNSKLLFPLYNQNYFYNYTDYIFHPPSYSILS